MGWYGNLTLELTSFIFLVIISFVAILLDNINIIKYIFLPSYIFFIIVIRYSGFDTDMVIYSQYMHSFSFFMIKEFIFYGLITQVYNLFQNEINSFIFIDIIVLLLLVYFLRKLNKHYIMVLPIFLLSFAFIMGMENVYRQLIASIVLLYSYVIRKDKEQISNLFFIISVFFHNSMIVFYPLLMLVGFFGFKFKLRIFLATGVLFISVILLTGVLQGIISGGKSNVSTGLNMSYAYYMLYLFATVFFIIKFKYKVGKYIKFFPSLYYSLFILFPLTFLSSAGSSAAERIGMTIVLFWIFELYTYSLSIKNKIKSNLFRVLLLLVFSLPTLIFSSSRNFLLTAVG